MDRLSLSGYRDSNPGLPTPEAGALTGLRYTPLSMDSSNERTKVKLYFGSCKPFYDFLNSDAKRKEVGCVLIFVVLGEMVVGLL